MRLHYYLLLLHLFSHVLLVRLTIRGRSFVFDFVSSSACSFLFNKPATYSAHLCIFSVVSPKKKLFFIPAIDCFGVCTSCGSFNILPKNVMLFSLFTWCSVPADSLIVLFFCVYSFYVTSFRFVIWFCPFSIISVSWHQFSYSHQANFLLFGVSLFSTQVTYFYYNLDFILFFFRIMLLISSLLIIASSN